MVKGHTYACRIIRCNATELTDVLTTAMGCLECFVGCCSKATPLNVSYCECSFVTKTDTVKSVNDLWPRFSVILKLLTQVLFTFHSVKRFYHLISLRSLPKQHSVCCWKSFCLSGVAQLPNMFIPLRAVSKTVKVPLMLAKVTNNSAKIFGCVDVSVAFHVISFHARLWQIFHYLWRVSRCIQNKRTPLHAPESLSYIGVVLQKRWISLFFY